MDSDSRHELTHRKKSDIQHKSENKKDVFFYLRKLTTFTFNSHAVQHLLSAKIRQFALFSQTRFNAAGKN